MKGITLIGMPGSGKSTIGKLLARRLNFNFIDLDILIKEKEGDSHEVILTKRGEQAFLQIEEQYALGLDFNNLVFSPGGSIVYLAPAMMRMRAESVIFYLDLPLDEIQKRLGNQINARGIVGLREKGLEKLYLERTRLYKQYSHYQLNCLSLSQDEIINKIMTSYWET